MASIINASSTGSGGIVQTADASGVLQLQSNGTVAVNIATTGYVGVGTTSPSYSFEVQRNANDSLTRVNVQNPNAGSSAIAILGVGNDQTSTGAGIKLGSSTWTGGANTMEIFNNLSGGVFLSTSGTSRMAISNAGIVTTPYRPQCYAFKSTNTTLSSTDVVIIHDTVVTNTQSCYNASNGRFTAPVAGMYQVNSTNTVQTTSAASTYMACYLYYNGTNSNNISNIRGRGTTSNGFYSGASFSGCIYLNANDYIQVYAYAQSSGVQLNASEQTFSCFLIG